MDMTVTIWHNPRCSKSRQTLKLLEERGITPVVRLYLKDPPSTEEISSVIAKLDIPAISLVRTGEAAFRDLGLSKDTPSNDLIDAMAGHPILIERPIVLKGDAAVIGRPPEAVLALL